MEILGITDSTLRLGVFLTSLVEFSVAEAWWPRRVRVYPRWRRWPTNLLVLVIGAAAVRGMAALSLPLVAVATAHWADEHRFGLLNVIVLPTALEFVLTLLLLDLLIWGQHLAFHRMPWCWRWHRVHHADRDIDASTALRFHPGEIVLSMLVKCLAVLALGAPVVAVIVFEIVLNGMALFNHANLRLPESVDRLLQRVVVTPDMHRIHHSIRLEEQHRNFGFSLSVWDRLFGSYAEQPRDGHAAMRIGLVDCQTDAPTQLGWTLRSPWASAPSSDAAARTSEPTQ